MSALELAGVIRATLTQCSGDRYAEIRAVLSMLADRLESEVRS
jgi:hypothetical protein